MQFDCCETSTAITSLTPRVPTEPAGPRGDYDYAGCSSITSLKYAGKLAAAAAAASEPCLSVVLPSSRPEIGAGEHSDHRIHFGRSTRTSTDYGAPSAADAAAAIASTAPSITCPTASTPATTITYTAEDWPESHRHQLDCVADRRWTTARPAILYSDRHDQFRCSRPSLDLTNDLGPNSRYLSHSARDGDSLPMRLSAWSLSGSASATTTAATRPNFAELRLDLPRSDSSPSPESSYTQTRHSSPQIMPTTPSSPLNARKPHLSCEDMQTSYEISTNLLRKIGPVNPWTVCFRSDADFGPPEGDVEILTARCLEVPPKRRCIRLNCGPTFPNQFTSVLEEQSKWSPKSLYSYNEHNIVRGLSYISLEQQIERDTIMELDDEFTDEEATQDVDMSSMYEISIEGDDSFQSQVNSKNNSILLCCAGQEIDSGVEKNNEQYSVNVQAAEGNGKDLDTVPLIKLFDSEVKHTNSCNQNICKTQACNLKVQNNRMPIYASNSELKVNEELEMKPLRKYLSNVPIASQLSLKKESSDSSLKCLKPQSSITQRTLFEKTASNNILDKNKVFLQEQSDENLVQAQKSKLPIPVPLKKKAKSSCSAFNHQSLLRSLKSSSSTKSIEPHSTSNEKYISRLSLKSNVNTHKKSLLRICSDRTSRRSVAPEETIELKPFNFKLNTSLQLVSPQPNLIQQTCKNENADVDALVPALELETITKENEPSIRKEYKIGSLSGMLQESKTSLNTKESNLGLESNLAISSTRDVKSKPSSTFNGSEQISSSYCLSKLYDYIDLPCNKCLNPSTPSESQRSYFTMNQSGDESADCDCTNPSRLRLRLPSSIEDGPGEYGDIQKNIVVLETERTSSDSSIKEPPTKKRHKVNSCGDSSFTTTIKDLLTRRSYSTISIPSQSYTVSPVSESTPHRRQRFDTQMINSPKRLTSPGTSIKAQTSRHNHNKNHVKEACEDNLVLKVRAENKDSIKAESVADVSQIETEISTTNYSDFTLPLKSLEKIPDDQSVKDIVQALSLSLLKKSEFSAGEGSCKSWGSSVSTFYSKKTCKVRLQDNSDDKHEKKILEKLDSENNFRALADLRTAMQLEQEDKERKVIEDLKEVIPPSALRRSAYDDDDTGYMKHRRDQIQQMRFYEIPSPVPSNSSTAKLEVSVKNVHELAPDEEVCHCKKHVDRSRANRNDDDSEDRQRKKGGCGGCFCCKELLFPKMSRNYFY